MTTAFVFLTLLFAFLLAEAPVFADNVKHYLDYYNEVDSDNLKLRQERLEMLIAELKTASKKAARRAPPLIELLRTLIYFQLERQNGKGAIDTSNYIIEKIGELCPVESDAQSALNINRLDRAKAYLILARG